MKTTRFYLNIPWKITIELLLEAFVEFSAHDFFMTTIPLQHQGKLAWADWGHHVQTGHGEMDTFVFVREKNDVQQQTRV